MINTLKALAGLGLLVGLVYAVFYFSIAGRISPDQATLSRLVQLGIGMGRLENELSNPAASFYPGERPALEQWLAPYPKLKEYVKNTLSSWEIARVYAYDQGYAQALVLVYSSTGSSESLSILSGYAIQVRDPSRVVGSGKK